MIALAGGSGFDSQRGKLHSRRVLAIPRNGWSAKKSFREVEVLDG